MRLGARRSAGLAVRLRWVADAFVAGVVVSFVLVLSFAGAGGTMNLSQSNYIKDKGYGMGSHLGRITSPLITRPSRPPA